MTKWINPDLTHALFDHIDSHADVVLFLSEAPFEGSINEKTIVGSGRLGLTRPIERTPHGGWSMTFSVADRDALEEVWDETPPVDYLKATRTATITHVAVAQDQQPSIPAFKVYYVTHCRPSPVVVGQELTCVPFTLALGGSPL